MIYKSNEQLITELKKLLLDTGYSQRDIAKQMNISPQAFQNLLNKKQFSFADLKRVLDCINCDLLVDFCARPTPATISAGTPAHAPGHTAAAAENTKKQYRRFTPKDAGQIDRQRLVSDIQYQLDISLEFGSDVLSSLLAEAKQTTPSPSDDIAKSTSNNTAASPDTRHKAPALDPAIAGNETLSEKLARLRREHSAQEPASSETAPD